MKILLTYLAMFTSCYFAGGLLTKLGSKPAPSIIRKFLPHLGYCYFILAFYMFYVLTKNAVLATVLTIILPITVFIVAKIKRHSKKKDATNCANKEFLSDYQALLPLTAIIFLMSAWPYLASGWGNYWHSGNQDIEDGMLGRDAYLQHKIFECRSFLLENVVGDAAWVDFVKKTKVKDYEKHTSYYSWYAGDSFRFQYSNLAFWSSFFQEKYGMDIVIIQALLNLSLMAIGTYWLCKDFFRLDKAWAFLGALSSTGAAFYFGTFWAGHIGSLMYGAVAPMIAACLLIPVGWINLKTILPWLAMPVLAMSYTYPAAVVIGAIYWLGYQTYCSSAYKHKFAEIYKNNGKNWISVAGGIVIGIIILFGTIYLIWELTKGIRIRADYQYRAWGVTKDIGILPLFLGFLPDQASLANITAYKYLSIAGCILVGSILVLLIIINKSGQEFIRYFIVMWLLGLLAFYIFIQDSYYIYKYMYIHLFMLIICLTKGLEATKRMSAKLAGGLVLGVNLFCNVKQGVGVYNHPFNHFSSELTELVNQNLKCFPSIFIDVHGGAGTAIREKLKSKGQVSQTDPRYAYYFLIEKDKEDVTKSQFTTRISETKHFELREAPLRNYLMLRTWFKPETSTSDTLLPQMPFRWVTSGENDNVAIYIVRPEKTERSAKGRYLRIGVQKGPSCRSYAEISAKTGELGLLVKKPLEGTRFIYLEKDSVIGATQSIILSSGVMGRNLRPPEDRKLIYRIFSIGWTDEILNQEDLAVLNWPSPIGDLKKNCPIAIYGNGWYGVESDNGKHFRWGASQAEIVAFGVEKRKNSTLSFDFEWGPSHGQKSTELAVVDAAGMVVAKIHPQFSRSLIELPLKRSGTYTLISQSENKMVKNDYRIMDFRVFNLSLK